MISKLSNLWKLFPPAETVDKVADASGKVFDLAEALKDANAPKKISELAKKLKDDNQKSELVKLVGQIPTILEALNSPLGQVVKSLVPFLPIATGIIQLAIEANKKEPTIAETVALVSQVAYLQSIQEIFPQDSIFTEDTTKQSQAVKKQLQKLEDLEISDREARGALSCFHQSKLAESFNQVLATKLHEIGIAGSEVEIWVKRVAMNTQRSMITALVDSREGVQQLIDWYSAGGKEQEEKYQSIDEYLEEIKKLPEAKVFREKFSFNQIYIPLKAKSINAYESSLEYENLEAWTGKFILDSQQSKQVLFIEAGAGRGKSVFCRMFADLVRQYLHPIITPILIRLRDIENYDKTIDEILTEELKNRDFVRNDDGWLTDKNTRYLFLLDGFDELRIEGRASDGVKKFIQKVGKFQSKFSGNDKETGHRVIITGRSIALQGIKLPKNLTRVEIQPMDDEIRGEWLKKWAKVIIPNDPMAGWQETEKFKAFLSANNCPKDIKNDLAREPLLLYLLAKLHLPDINGTRQISKDDFTVKKDNSDLELLRSSQTKALIYEKSLNWVLEEQRNDEVLADLQKEITGLTKDSLKRILMEAGLCIVQSGGEYGKVNMIETRLKKDKYDNTAAELIQKLREKSRTKNSNLDEVLNTSLGAFYIKPRGGGFEFYHKSFGEYLFAKRVATSLENWVTLANSNSYEEEIYDLLGYGALTVEIVEYLWGLLLKSDEFQPEKLFERLNDFYKRWCDGEFIDYDKATLPLKKIRELKKQFPDRETNLGQRHVDVYAGLNIMILLLKLHRYGQSLSDENIKQKLTFYPCGEPNQAGELEEPTKLSIIIGYSKCVGVSGFRYIVGNFLDGSNLEGANLEGDNLKGANLEGANLEGANLEGANLEGANLEGANLPGANLEDAKLEEAKLFRANLEGAYLERANLKGANLEGANLEGAKLEDANLEDANLEDANLERANLERANLEDVKLLRARLLLANLERANLERANLEGANLEGAKLEGANLLRARLKGAKLEGANLLRANLEGANLLRARLKGANLFRANLEGANLVGANLLRANLVGANLLRANLADAYLSHVNLVDANLETISWDESTYWNGVLGLNQARNVPEDLTRYLAQKNSSSDTQSSDA